jgi:hypothetical protein
VDGNRRYADEPAPSWYTGQSATPTVNPYDSGVHDRPSGAFRLDGPPQPYPEPAPTQVRGPEYPAVRPPGGTSLADAPPPNTYGSPQRSVTPYDEATSVVPPMSRFRPESRAPRMFRSRRPVSAIVVAGVTGVLMIPAIMLLINATFGDGPMLARGVIPAVLLTLGLPLTGGGLYALAGGPPPDRDAWLRPPLAYLPIGLLILLAAGLGAA